MHYIFYFHHLADDFILLYENNDLLDMELESMSGYMPISFLLTMKSQILYWQSGFDAPGILRKFSSIDSYQAIAIS